VCVCVCVCVHVFVCFCVCVCVCVCLCVFLCVCFCVWLRVCVYIHVCIYIYKCIYEYTYIYLQISYIHTYTNRVCTKTSQKCKSKLSELCWYHTYESVTPFTCELVTSRYTFARVVSYISMRQVIRGSARVMSHVCMSHVIESCQTCERVLSHIYVSRAANMDIYMTYLHIYVSRAAHVDIYMTYL